MGRILQKYIVLTVAVAALSACADLKRYHRAGAAGGVESSGFAEWSLIVNGERIEDLLNDPEDPERKRLNDVLNQLNLKGIDIDDTEALSSLLARIERGEAADDIVPEELQGIGGVSTALFLREALLNQKTEIRGKIKHYYYNDYTDGGYLEVKTIVTVYERSGRLIQKDRFFWAIGIRPELYEVHKKGKDFNPFPGAMTISDPEILDDMIERGLDHKLHAKGVGIIVLGVFRNAELLPLNHEYYESTSASCVDLLFRGYPPESVLPEQSGYCLGRCDHPMIVNTGAGG